MKQFLLFCFCLASFETQAIICAADSSHEKIELSKRGQWFWQREISSENMEKPLNQRSIYFRTNKNLNWQHVGFFGKRLRKHLTLTPEPRSGMRAFQNLQMLSLIISIGAAIVGFVFLFHLFSVVLTVGMGSILSSSNFWIVVFLLLALNYGVILLRIRAEKRLMDAVKFSNFARPD